jgi:hypothetical protein
MKQSASMIDGRARRPLGAPALPELPGRALNTSTINGMDEESLASPEVLTSLSQALSNLVLGDNEIRAEYEF